MDKPKEKWWKVTKFDVGCELANPDYVKWADERIAVLEAKIEKFDSSAGTPNKKNSSGATFLCCTCSRLDVCEYIAAIKTGCGFYSAREIKRCSIDGWHRFNSLRGSNFCRECGVKL